MITRISKLSHKIVKSYLRKYNRENEYKRIMSDMSQLRSMMSNATYYHDNRLILGV